MTKKVKDSDEIADQVKRLPKHPGVYLMKDAEGTVIYIGKARNIRSRVMNYFQGSDDRRSIPHLLRRLVTLEHIVTETEQQAFVLERDLIQKYRPRYNIRLKDDKAYLMVRLDQNALWPKLELVRRQADDGAKYFGPYTFSYELRMVLDLIKKVVPLRTCNDTVFHNRMRPCLEYQIKRCCGPCCLDVDRDQYMEWVKQAVSILEGNTTPILENLETQMNRASESMEFEEAATYRDRIKTIQNFSEKKQLQTDGENRDVFAIYREERLLALSVLIVRNGRIADNVSFFLEDQELESEEILEAAVSQYYSGNREVPVEIILPFELGDESLLYEGLKERRKGRFEIIVPKRGVKYRLLGLAELNARQQFLSHFNREARYREISEALGVLLKLRQIPRKIECVDISNLQGSDIVGALVCFYDGEPLRKAYRRYHISTQGKPDDFGAIYEVVTRRLRSGLQHDDLPDLLVIDGGAGQLSKAIEACDDVGVSLDVVAMAKMRTESNAKTRGSFDVAKPERIFIPGGHEPVILRPDAESTLFLQRVRDEVHDTAIAFHRKTRAKKIRRSLLDDVRGVGPERKHRLMKTFGSLKKIGEAQPEEVARAGRMPLPLAKKILAAIKKGS